MTSSRRSAFSLGCLSALLYVLAQPPLSLWFLAYFCLIPLLLALRQKDLRTNFFVGWLSGSVAFVGLVYWVVIAMNTYGGIPIPLAFLALLLLAAYLGLYVGLFTLSVSWLEQRQAIPLFFSAPLIWVLLEYLRAFLLTGFPWSYLAHSQHNFLPVVQVASLTGSYFLSFLIVGVNVVLYGLLGRRTVPLWYRGLVILLLVLSLGFGLSRLYGGPQEMAPDRKVAIIQGNIPQDLKFSEAWKIKTVRTYLDLTLSRGRDVDLVIWPETALPFVWDEQSEVAKVLATLPKALSNNLLFGAISRDGQGRHYNSAYLSNRAGDFKGYSKVHLVPFGEFTPLRRFFPFLEKLSVAMGDFFQGTGHYPLSSDTGRLGILICYEGVFPQITNETARRGAEVFVNMTNDAWFGRTSAPYQHLAFYVFRAVETDRYVLRAANTGISAVIDPRGRVVARTGLFSEEVLRGTFSLRGGVTPYARFGDWFVLLAFLLLALPVVRRLVSVWYRRG